jgi:hypothetical protein
MTRLRSTDARVADLKRWLKKNKSADCKEFVKETGGTKTQYYHFRYAMGITRRNSALSGAMKQVAAKRREQKVADAATTVIEKTKDLFEKQKDNEKLLSDKSAPVVDAPKAEEVAEGTTPDFMWYELDLMQRRLQDFSLRLNVVMKLSRARDADHKKMMRDLISENSELRVSNNDLRQQVAEFTEMINGTPV